MMKMMMMMIFNLVLFIYQDPPPLLVYKNSVRNHPLCSPPLRPASRLRLLLLRRRGVLTEEQLQQPIRGSGELFKFSLCVMSLLLLCDMKTL